MRFSVSVLLAMLLCSGTASAQLYSNDIEWTRFVNGEVGAGFPKIASGDWADFTNKASVDAAFRFSVNGRIYVFRGYQYYRLNAAGTQVDPGYPRIIGVDGWKGLGYFGDFDAVVEHPTNGLIYFFKGTNYYRFSVAQDEFLPWPRTIGVHGWPGVNWTGNGVDAAVYRSANDKVYFFSGDTYVRYDLGNDAVDAGYPKRIGELGWPGLRKELNAAVDRGNDTIDFLHPAAPDRTLEVVFNPSLGADVKNSAIHDKIVYYLEGAAVGSEVWMSVAGFDNVAMAPAIRDAYDRGVEIRLVTHRIRDGGTYNYKWVDDPVAAVLFPKPGSGHNSQDPFLLNNVGIWEIDPGDRPEELGLRWNHAKFFLFENSRGESNISIITSANLRGADQVQQNDAIVLPNDRVYNELRRVISRMFDLARGGPVLSTDTHMFGRTFEIDRDLEVYVTTSAEGGDTPRDPHLDLLNDIEIVPGLLCQVWAAGSSWDMANPRGADVANKLIDLHNAGCSVWVAGNDGIDAPLPQGHWVRDTRETDSSVFDVLSNASVPWSKTIHHSKYLAVNAPLKSRDNALTKAVTAGALNFTYTLIEDQVDVGYTVYDADVYCAYQNNWIDLWNDAFETSEFIWYINWLRCGVL